MNTQTHLAWRFLNNRTLYVEEINTSGKGDKYSYIDDHRQAKQMTEQQCRTFCNYMKQCDAVGFWS